MNTKYLLHQNHFRGNMCIISPSWISNGIFGLKRSIVQNERLFRPDVINDLFDQLKIKSNIVKWEDDEKFLSLLKDGEYIVYTKTKWLYCENNIPLRVFKDDNSNAAFFNEKTISFLNVDKLLQCVDAKGKDSYAFINDRDDFKLCCCSVKVGELEETYIGEFTRLMTNIRLGNNIGKEKR